MNEPEILEMIEHLRFKMDLLFENTDFSRFLYEYDITKEQNRKICDVMEVYRNKIDNNEEISSAQFETEILSIVDRSKCDYHFCESYAELCWKDGRWEEVFPALYGDNIKFKHLFNK